MATNISSQYAASLLAAPAELNRLILVLNASNNASGAVANAASTIAGGTESTTAATTAAAAQASYAAIVIQIDAVETYLSTIVISFGIVCNILTLLTLRDPDLKEAPYTYLTALAVADLSGLILAFCMYLIKLLKDYISSSSYAYCWWSVYVYYPLINVACSMTTSIMVLMTAERCLYIQFPFKVRTYFTNKQTRIKIIIVLIGCFVINFPRFLWYKPDKLTTSLGGNVTSNHYRMSRNHHGKHFAVIITWIHSAVLHCLPLVLLIFLNAFLIYKFRNKRGRSLELGISRTIVTIWDREQSRLTFTYIAIVCLFIITTMPSAFADENISTALFSSNRHSLSIRILQYVSNFLMWLNLSSIHFAMYAFINTKFQRAFRIMLRRWLARLRYILCKKCAPCTDSPFKRNAWSETNTFYMVNHDEQIPFNNGKNRLQNQQSNMSTNSKENSFTTVTFRLMDG